VDYFLILAVACTIYAFCLHSDRQKKKRIKKKLKITVLLKEDLIWIVVISRWRNFLPPHPQGIYGIICSFQNHKIKIGFTSGNLLVRESLSCYLLTVLG